MFAPNGTAQRVPNDKLSRPQNSTLIKLGAMHPKSVIVRKHTAEALIVKGYAQRCTQMKVQLDSGIRLTLTDKGRNWLK